MNEEMFEQVEVEEFFGRIPALEEEIPANDPEEDGDFGQNEPDF